MKTRVCVVALIALQVLSGLAAQPQRGELKFQAQQNEFTFDTRVLRGKLHAGGKSIGLSGVTHVPTGMRLDASMGLLSHYRLFTANTRYGAGAWDFQTEAKAGGDGSVEVKWVSQPGWPFELSASYRLSAPNTIDLITQVTAKSNLANFESFLASYFSPAFTNSSVYARATEGSRLVPAEQSAGTWQAFPRDDAAVSILTDGRWKLEPHPVDWVIRPQLVSSLALRRCPVNGLTAVLMSPPGDCFAVLTPFESEPHYSTYLSLFGRDLKAGETARAQARLVILEKASEQEILKIYQSYLSRVP